MTSTWPIGKRSAASWPCGQKVDLGLLGAVFRRVAQPLLGEDHAALGLSAPCRSSVSSLAVSRISIRPVSRLSCVAARQVELIDRLGPSGLGVGVGPEGEAQALQDLDHVAGRHVGRALERHVFEHVGQALLARRSPPASRSRCAAAGRSGPPAWRCASPRSACRWAARRTAPPGRGQIAGGLGPGGAGWASAAVATAHTAPRVAASLK